VSRRHLRLYALQPYLREIDDDPPADDTRSPAHRPSVGKRLQRFEPSTLCMASRAWGRSVGQKTCSPESPRPPSAITPHRGESGSSDWLRRTSVGSTERDGGYGLARGVSRPPSGDQSGEIPGGHDTRCRPLGPGAVPSHCTAPISRRDPATRFTTTSVPSGTAPSRSSGSASSVPSVMPSTSRTSVVPSKRVSTTRSPLSAAQSDATSVAASDGRRAERSGRSRLPERRGRSPRLPPQRR
jgi:hypothetical protein